jgi:sugar transferase (PEP-CTERM/EpsH1 system associated)
MMRTSDPIRVVHLVAALNIGGLEMVVLDLVRFADCRFRLHVLCLDDRGALAPRFEALGVAVESLDAGNRGRGKTLLRLIGRLAELRPDVLHTHNPRPHLLGVIAGRAAGVPVVVHTKHGRNYPERRRAVLLNRLAAQFTDRVVPVSADAGQVARQIEHVPAGKVHVIRNGIDLARFLPAPQCNGSRRLIHVARLDPIKDQATLLRAVRLIASVMPEVRLDIVGDGSARPALEQLTDSLQLRGHVRFLGFRSDVSECLAQADLFVLSSLKEGISLTLLEAMATGLPIVATDVGGNREVVSHGETGLLVPAQSPELLAAAIQTILGQPELARRMGAAGRQRVEAQFDLRQVVRQYEEMYVALLRRKRPIAA